MDDRGKDIVSWYAVHVRARHEFKVRDQLAGNDIEVFLPQIEKLRKWSDRKKLVSFPLFPGYCFARFSLENRIFVLNARGVVKIIGNSQGPLPVPEEEMESVRRLVNSPLKYNPHPGLEKGMTVEVIQGPLKGLRGKMVRRGSRAQFIISIDLIGQGVSTELNADALLVVKDAARAD